MSETETTATTENGDIETYLDSGKPNKWYKRKRWWALGLLLILIIVAVSQCSGGEDQPDYITAEVETRSLDLTVTATGSLRPTNQVEVGSEVSGRIDRVLVDVNDQVQRGQVLAIINTELIDDQIRQGQANLNSARAQVGQAQATLDGDQAQLNRLLEVQRISGGRVPSEAEIDQARA
ncbi:MAG: biotin/lipoyl-binding protein, partial [Alteraurantiacibacter sp.]